MRPQSFRFFFFVVLTFVGTTLSLQASASMVPRAPQIDARGYLLMDAASGHIIVEHNAEQRLPPASLTKMMTAYIAEAELQKGNLSEDDMAPISVKAWKMGGSRMFVKEGTRVSVGELLKGIIIQSGNDASVAMAEYIAGSEDAFADLMNQHARRLGMNQSHFMNATGWPAENHFTTARDMAILARAIVRDFPEHYDIYAEKEFTYNGITQQNRNLLLWRDESVDGLKTGHTEEAGYCLVSSAKKDGMRLIAVVMGTDSEGARARESQKLLTYGFRFFETYKAYSAGDILDTAELWMGDKDQVRLGLAEDLVLTIPRESHENLKAEVTVNPQLQAPINQGEKYGTVTVRMNNELLVEKPLVALESVEEAGLFTRLWHHILLFFKGLF
ncbi:D-alanyl-D-alanine carboxypeptidase [Alcanivorax sp. P2S70]|uniref:serine-type D-Ala-D-Ala carboxypeptidase n=1 Tax=Alcanivorax profundi TaxID=2338368 RepID=A0A418XWH8_9GAMM|nr:MULTISPECIES: D-alanyl-D-alanine carboxypeptidase family protein [Alcanivorax]ERP85330.1 D-alanyl-D-alanine carboxypeptidase [Alcanivorax sp. P2S70]RJG17177.1 D-alanyl-D-alanine carboxypeptidase [Alcanivorax profundi]